MGHGLFLGVGEMHPSARACEPRGPVGGAVGAEG
jgi:hypothetical protein